MLCVWGKKKLELEHRQQLGGGGAQSIKVGPAIGVQFGSLFGVLLAQRIKVLRLNLTTIYIEDIYFCQVLKDRLLVAVSEYILVLDHSCQVTRGPSHNHL